MNITRRVAAPLVLGMIGTVTLGTATSTVTAGSAAFVPLGDLPGGEHFSQAFGVSDDGQIVGGMSVGGSLIQPVIWDGLMMSVLPVPIGYDGAFLNDVSGDGSSAVAIAPASDGSGFFGIHWDAKGNTHVVQTTQPGAISVLICLDFEGDTAGGATEQNFFGEGDGLIYSTSTGEQNVGDLPGGMQAASLIGVTNDGGTFVGFGTDDLGRRPVKWDAVNGFQPLAGVPSGDGTGTAVGIAADGGVITGELIIDTVPTPTYWDASGDAHLIDFWPGYVVGSAVAVSADGTVIVGTWKIDPFADELGSRAFIWDAVNGVRPLQDYAANELGLNLEGWTLNTANDITPDGKVIIGAGVNGDGQLEAYKLVIDPGTGCPADLTGDDLTVNVFDLLELLGAWGACGAAPAECPADLTGDEAVNVFDLLELLGAWGACDG